MTKQIFTFLFLLIFPSLVFSQGGTVIADKGFGVVAVDKKMSSIKSYLVAIDKSKLRDSSDAAGVGDEYSSAWNVDLKKAKMESYFGQKVTSVEVYFDYAYDNQGEQTKNEIVARFIVYFEAPKDKEDEIGFQAKLMVYYGDAIMAQTDDKKDIMNFTWFSDVTLLQVNFGYDGEKKSDVYAAYFGRSKG